MKASALVLLAALFADPRGVDECEHCRPARVCIAHQKSDRQRIEELEEAQASINVDERRQALRDLAALNEAHANSPSSKVTEAMALGLADMDLGVRLETVELLERSGHGSTATKELVSALVEVGRLLKSWKDVEELSDDPDDERLNVYRETVQTTVQGLQDEFEKLRDTLKSLEDLILKFDSDGDSRATQLADLKKTSEGLVQAFDLRKRELTGLVMTPEAVVLGTRFAQALGRIHDERSVKPVMTFYSTLTRYAPSRGLPVAQVLVELGRRDAVQAVVRSLSDYAAAVVPNEGDPSVAESIHALLTQTAAERGLKAMPEWGPDAPSLWTQWLKLNRGEFPTRIAK